MPALKKNPDGSPHIHKYIRVKDKRPDAAIRYACVHPDCSSVMPRSLLHGKRTLCGKCGHRETVFDYENLRRDVPVCIHCSRSKAAAEARRRIDAFEEIFGKANGGD